MNSFKDSLWTHDILPNFYFSIYFYGASFMIWVDMEVNIYTYLNKFLANWWHMFDLPHWLYKHRNKCNTKISGWAFNKPGAKLS